MKRFAYSLAILAACLPFQAQAGEREYQDIKKVVRENAPPPALLAKIQLATQAYQNTDSVTKEAKMVRVLDAAQARGTAIGGAIGSHASEGNED